ncbi:acyltransferase [Paenibacillus naphthalenovorans]|uniref:acyltransferase n=1 Tax=Paenibacillus naphthalenovorans TaxID=162209 RepID=UPI0010B9346F|nr:acyltransferase [Paenibacillus naphthalenovorans]GCL72382.1 N-acetyltransferase [Paenibacillus naphthalenovorans]
MSEAYIHSSAHISEGAKIGAGTKIWINVQVREASEIGQDCNIGKDVYIDAHVKIGNRVKIQNGVTVYQGVEVEDDVFLGPQMTFTNDMYPRAFNADWKIVRTKVRYGASIAANATIVCGVEIGRFAMVAAGAVVTKDVPDFGLVRGVPAKLVGYVCQCGQPAQNIESVLHCADCGKKIDLNTGVIQDG